MAANEPSPRHSAAMRTGRAAAARRERWPRRYTLHIGLPLRAGLHTGEIELMGRNIGGIAVHAAARVMAQSGSNEVLVSRVVTDLVAGTGLKFSDRGSYELKGVPGR